MASRQYQYTNGLIARRIDELLTDSDPDYIEILDRTDFVDKLIIDFSLEKKPPFFGSDLSDKTKNEVADAVIFFSVYEYLKKYRGDFGQVIFVSNNKADFSDEGNGFIWHRNLKVFADEIDMQFFNDFERAVKHIDPENRFYVDDLEDKAYFLSDRYFDDCSECGKEVHINADSYLNSMDHRPPVYYLRCPNCAHTWSTGTSIHDELY